MKFRQTLHINSPALKKIAFCMSKDGYFYHDGQRRKVESFKRHDGHVVLTGKILSEVYA